MGSAANEKTQSKTGCESYVVGVESRDRMARQMPRHPQIQVWKVVSELWKRGIHTTKHQWFSQLSRGKRGPS